MIEVLIALFLTMIGVMALITMLPQGWLFAGRSDVLGRAAEILHEEFETNEVFIMNACNPVTAGTTSRTVFASGQGAAQQGDLRFTVQTTITSIGTNVWRVTAVVTWPGNNTGIRDSLVVTRQEYFKQGC
jgi:Tfp pilus assembly protein PilV